MELDDQLAALAAGELDDETARAVRARASADPALARRLARHESLQTMLTGWSAPTMSDDAVARLEAAVDAALDDLGDGPLVDRAAPSGRPALVPLRPDRDDESPAPAAASGPSDVVDLAAARERREQRRALPGWLTGTAVAAALLAVVGTGVVLGTGGFSGSDDVDTVADATTDVAADDAAESSMAGAEGAMDESAELAPTSPDGIDVPEGELLALLGGMAQDGDTAAEETIETDADDAGDTDDADDTDESARADCTAVALDRDTTDGAVDQVIDGTYGGAPAQFVIVRSPTDEAGDRYDVLAYDPVSCELLDRDSDVR